jgi:hypothetical protein
VAEIKKKVEAPPSTYSKIQKFLWGDGGAPNA